MLDGLPAAFNTPELRLDCDEARKFAIVDEVRERLRRRGAEITDIDGVRVKTADGWWLVRASNTQAVVVARAEVDERRRARRGSSEELAAELAASGLSLPECPESAPAGVAGRASGRTTVAGDALAAQRGAGGPRALRGEVQQARAVERRLRAFFAGGRICCGLPWARRDAAPRSARLLGRGLVAKRAELDPPAVAASARAGRRRALARLAAVAAAASLPMRVGCARRGRRRAGRVRQWTAAAACWSWAASAGPPAAVARGVAPSGCGCRPSAKPWSSSAAISPSRERAYARP